MDTNRATRKGKEEREPLAIVGIGCRFPGGVESPESFWKLLAEGRSGIVEVPADRWNRDRYYDPDTSIPRKMHTKWGGFVDHVDEFDAQFWGISPREALRMDPQQRWLLECTWEALENAGYRAAALRGSRTGVYIGIASNDYAQVQMTSPEDVDVHTNSGSTLSIASNRIAYLLDLKGPALSVDTACSSALVAINIGCKDIWNGTVDAALVGGVNALLTPDTSIGFSKATMLSPSGQCFAFDERANGYVRGEGAGVLFLVPLSKAIANGDRIYATVRSAVINQDGNTSSMTVPGQDTQEMMLVEAYQQAGFEPSRVTYMEAHGTGTPVGDPIETNALGNILSQGRKKGEECLIGSVKTNIGHLESGSGAAGMVKAALVLSKGLVPPTLNFVRPNPNIDFEALKLKVVTKLTPLKAHGDFPPVASVNSFGFGGTNAHIVLEAAPKSTPKSQPKRAAERPYVLPISARDERVLRTMADHYRRALAGHADQLADFCYSAGARREHLEKRAVVVGASAAELQDKLRQIFAGTEEIPGVVQGSPVPDVPPVVFVFTGQGAQWWKMGQELLQREPVFRKMIERVDREVRKLGDWSLLQEMTRSEADSKINRTYIAQPAIFALQVALAELWKSWGVQPAKVVGHSVGEVAAAYVAGVYTLEDAVKVIYHRSRLQEKTGGDGNKGRMYAVGLSDGDARRRLQGLENRVEVAVVNSPTMVTLAGDKEPLERLAQTLEAEGIFVRQLRINYAFHTHQMDPIRDELLETLKDIQPKPTRIPYISTVTGGAMRGEELDGTYWWRNVRESVLFAPAMMNLIRGGERLFLEIGPHPALQSPMTECLQEQNKKGHVFSSLMRKEDETTQMLRNLAGLHNLGVTIDWREVNQAAGNFVEQPAYAWNRERFWLESEEGRHIRCDPQEHPLLGLRVKGTKPTWEFYLDPRLFPYLDDHRFWDSIIFPASGYGEIGLALCESLFPGEDYCVEELEMKKALFVSESKIPTVRVMFDDEDRSFRVYSNASGNPFKEWDLNAQGRLRKLGVPSVAPADFEGIKRRMERHFDHEEYYSDYADAGYQFGPNFQHLQNVWRRRHESFAEIVAPEGVVNTLKGYRFHPALLDAVFHAVKGAQIVPDDAKGTDYFYLPAAIRRIRVFREPVPTNLWTHAKVYFDDGESMISDLFVYDANQEPVAEVIGFRVDRVEQKDEKEEELDNSFYQFRWESRRLKGSRVTGTPGFAPISAVVRKVMTEMPKIYDRYGLNRYYEGFEVRLDRTVAQSIINSFLELGWAPEVGDRVELDSFVQQLGILDIHRRLTRSHLNSLAKHGWLKKEGAERWSIAKPIFEIAVGDELEALCQEYPAFASEARLQQVTGPVLAGVLTGNTDPVELLFPSGKSIDALTTFYREGGDFAANNDMIGLAVTELVKSVPSRRAIRILEVGAGTGSLTRSVLPVLEGHRTEYVFTDTSPAFLADAKKQFGDYPFVEYRTFDIEKSLEAQGIDAGSFDLVLATNVVHATADLKHSLSNLRRCLAQDGVIMFLEVTNERITLDNVFGLLRGWWYYRDTDLRPSSALLPRQRWEGLLNELGFEDVDSFVSSEKPEECQQAVFLARSPSVPEVAQEENSAPEAGTGTGVQGETFVLLADQGGVASKLPSSLEAAGHRVITVRPGVAFAAQSEGVYVINPVVRSDWERLFAELQSLGCPPARLVHCWTLDDPGTSISLDRLESVQTTGVHSLRVLVHAMHHIKPDPAPRIMVVTRGRISVAGERLHAISAAPLTGFCRVMNNEHPDWPVVMVDLDPLGDAAEAADVADELLLPDAELEVAYRNGIRHVNRLHRVREDEVPLLLTEAVQPDGRVLPYRLQIDKPGVLQNLSLNKTPRIEPREGEIEVRVKAGGINFRDVMKALGMYPGNPVDLRWFGDDISGTVVKVGPGVRDLKPGDDVVGMAPYAFRSYVTVNRNLVFRKPGHLSFEDAATLPTVFLTSHYALVHLARMQKGERVLIHAGTGGVGQAAIQIAKHLGLEIFSTAGSDDKRQMLRDMGVHHVMNSRTLDFADEIMAITEGEGIDCVLNSLAGDFIPKSFQCLRRFGRFIEIGKIDVYGNSKFGMEMLKNNISYFVVDLAQHLESKPEYVASMLKELEKELFAKNYGPLPHKVFPITEVVEAFRYMAQGKHVGKNVLNFDVPSIKIGPCTQDGFRLRSDASYLITGGAGGFGFELAKWMVKNGAKHLVLVSRSGPKEAAQKEIRRMQTQGVTVRDARADVTDRAALRKLVAEIQASPAPLAGVVHGAMVINDLDIIDLDEEGFNRVVHPKMLGAWILHELTKDLPLDLFVCFSSFSTVMGAVRQSNYNAGNAFLDAIAQHRRSLGLPGLTFNWGALKGAGFVDRNEKTEQYLELLGLSTYNMRETLSVFGRFIVRDPVNLAASRADWNSLSRFATLIQSKTYSNLVGEEGEGDRGAIRSQILQALPEARQSLMEDFIAEQVAGVFGTDVAKVDRDAPLNSIGLDSLMAIELMNRVESQLGISVPMGSVLNGPNIRELSEPILEALLNSAGDELAEGRGGGERASALNVPGLALSGTDVLEFPLSEGQKALWFLHQLAPESPAYNLVFSAKIMPLVDIEVMKKAFKGLFQRHPMLDVTFHTVKGEPRQRIRRGRTVDFREHDARRLSEEEIKHLIMQHANEPFDLANGPVVRLELFRTKDDAHITLFSIHHIVSDAWSVTMVMNDLIESYLAHRIGREPDWSEIRARYHDFVNWERSHLETESGARMLEYWKRHLEGSHLILDLPTDRPRPAVQTFNGGAMGFKLGKELTSKIIKTSESQNVTLFTTLLSAFDILLHRYCNQDDVVIGVPLAGRTQSELQDVAGYFINPVPVRSQVGDDPVFRDYLQRNSESVVGALENQHYPLPKLVDHLKVPRDPSRSPVFQVSFSMERIPGVDEQGIAVFLIGQGGHKFHIGDITVETVDLTLRHAQFEITLVVEEAGGQIYGCWQYNADLFDEATISNLNGLFAQILEQVVANPELRISEINLLNPDEEKKILQSWNKTRKPKAGQGLLHELVEARVSANPDKIAIRCGGDTLTFNQLDRRADGLAHELVRAGIRPDMPVALLVERSCEMVVGTLGILKAGGCYVPMDPEFPPYRLEQMLTDAKPGVVVTQRKLADRLPSGNWRVLYVESIQPSDHSPDVVGLRPESLAYIIYTSGSTGTPKGVEIPHRAAVNFLQSMQDRPGMDEDDRLLAVTTLSFDISLLEIYLPLMTGAECVIASRQEVKDGRHLGHMLEEFGITVMQATPATWRMLIEAGWHGKSDLRILCGGEALPRDLATRLIDKADVVWNMYGPTETTVWSTCDRVDSGEGTISIGRPIANTTVYVLDTNRRPVPVGFVGELYIGGVGLARGYHGKPALTSERFVEIALPGGAKERVYRTGDLARWRADGKLECLGRTDFQIKLRGVRMELDDIEAHVASHPKVKQAVVVKRDDLPGGPNLVAYVKPVGGSEGLTVALRQHVAERLPESMRPAFYSFVDEFPLTPNRKVDRRKLPAPQIDRSGMETEFVPARTASEKLLADIFAEAFERERMGIRDNFFEMGGDSLLAVRILAQASEAFNRHIPVEAFLRYPTIEQLANYLHSSEQEESVRELELTAGSGLDLLESLSHMDVKFLEEGARLPKVDAAALACIPESLLALSGLSRTELLGEWFLHQPHLASVYELPMGKIGLIILPLFEMDLFKNEHALRESVVSALTMAGQMGAKTVSLTGMLPSATDHGRDVIKWIAGRKRMPFVTTGDATRTATVIKTIEGVLEKTGRKFAEERVAFIGLGSIGKAAVRLALEVLPRPQELLLADPYLREPELQAIRDEIVHSGYRGSISVHPNGGGIPQSVYEASFLVGTTSIPGILDVQKLRPGSVLVDYSFPPSFRVADALRRFEHQNDVLFTTGGELSFTDPIRETVYLPSRAKQLTGNLDPRQLAMMAGRNAREITGCIVVSLLTDLDRDVKATLGPVSKADVLAHYQFLAKQGFKPARLQMQRYFLDPKKVESFARSNFGELSAS